MYYVFDVDGTLTPSRGTIDAEFAEWFGHFARSHAVCYATGSDRSKTVEQLGEELFNLAEYSFNCAGNEVYKNGKPIYKSDWQLPNDACLWLEEQLRSSKYVARYGKHFEQRTGLLNFSVVGRNARSSQRTAYYEWDKINNERNNIARAFNKQFPELKAQVGGETGIDIFARGHDKSQIIKYFTKPVKFYGDSMTPEGNDRPLADALVDNNMGQCYTVNNWQQTWDLLKALK